MLQSPYARHMSISERIFFLIGMLAVWCMSQEAVHFELIDYSQSNKKGKIIQKTNTPLPGN